MSWRSLLLLAGALLIASGCALVRAPILAAMPVDAGPRLDVPALDAPGLDAPLEDVPGLDAPPDLDAPLTPDAPDAPPVCTPTTETCNGVDEDCNGAIDDGVVCRACTAPGTCDDCVRFEAGGSVYQSCPALTGLEYWGRVCWTLGQGYELAVPEDRAESDAIAAALSANTDIDEFHWIGVNDFERNGTYLTVGGGALGWSPDFSDVLEPRDGEGVVVIETDAQWDDYPIDASFRILCELLPTARRCSATAASDSTCDGHDDDCDGFVDEDCTGPATCEARVFWTSVHYVCTDDMTFEEGEAACMAMDGALPSVLDHRFELQFADDFAAADAWVGLTQSDTVPEPGGWSWADGAAFTLTDRDWLAMWDTAQPSFMSAEDCAFIKDMSGRLQDHDCTMNRTATVCEHPLAP